VSFEVDDLQQMKAYLNGKGVETSGKIVEDGAGNQVFTFYDPSGIPVEYIKFSPNSLHKKSKGKFLAEERISKRIHHVGLYTESVKENDQFYKEILGFKEMWRFDDNDEAKLNFIYLQMPDCVENIEYCVMDNPHVNHPCLLVDDMQETIYTLKERRGDYKLAKPIVGKGNRWLLNIKNPDGTKVEFTEAHTIR